MAARKFMSYLRVSTTRQGISGLGLEAQRKTVGDFLNGGAWELLAEFVEVESGRAADRPELARALANCRITASTLIVANVSRLTRSVSFLSKLLDAGVEVRFCDLPQIEGPTGRFLLTQMVAVAELEAGLIGDRTKKALAAKREFYAKLDDAGRAELQARGKAVRLGNPANLANTEAGRIAGRARRTVLADQRAEDLAPIIRELQATGMTVNAIARELTRRGVATPRGRSAWASQQVTNALRRTPPSESVRHLIQPIRRHPLV